MLDDNGIRPPLIAAGINLFGGPLGLIHRHVTGAIPIRRNIKDPAYLVTLKAYVAEMLKKHDLFFYPEGGRSYSGELKPAKTGLIHAALTANCSNLVIVPTAISYDLVLEDHILARQRVKKTQRPFTRELAEMVRYAVGYRSRAFVTFGAPIPASDIQSAIAHRRPRADAAHPRAHQCAVQSAADGGLCRRDATVDHQARSGRSYRSASRRAGRPSREPGRHERTAGDRGSGRATRNARHHRARRRTIPRARAERAALLRALDRTPSRDHRPYALTVRSTAPSHAR